MNFASTQFKSHLYNDRVLANALKLLNLSILIHSSNHLKGRPLVLPRYQLRTQLLQKNLGETLYI